MRLPIVFTNNLIMSFDIYTQGDDLFASNLLMKCMSYRNATMNKLPWILHVLKPRLLNANSTQNSLTSTVWWIGGHLLNCLKGQARRSALIKIHWLMIIRAMSRTCVRFEDLSSWPEASIKEEKLLGSLELVYINSEGLPVHSPHQIDDIFACMSEKGKGKGKLW